MTKRGICELCGFNDNSFTIEENGNVMKVCKFCHDGHLERLGLPLDSDSRVDDITLTLDLDTSEDENIVEDLNLKVAPLSDDELNKILNPVQKEKELIKRAMKRRNTEVEKMLKEEETIREKEIIATTDKFKMRQDKARQRILSDVNQHIDDERIQITSPEIKLKKDLRPKTNLDAAIAENEVSVRFLEYFKYVFNKVTYAIFLGLIVLSVATILFITNSWQAGLITLGAGIGAIVIGFFLMWYVSRCLELDRRAYLFRIKQEVILFKSMKTDCYRELKTKYTIFKALSWFMGKLSVVLPLIVIVGTCIGAIILTFLYAYWLFAIVLGGAIIAGIITYWIVKFVADLLNYKLDIERNQQIAQQTMLDQLSK